LTAGALAAPVVALVFLDVVRRALASFEPHHGQMTDRRTVR
jgi:hypothetical protein